MSELTSFILISCYEITLIGKFSSHVWRLFFDNPLSMVLTKLETIHEKLIRLNVEGLMRKKNINWISKVVLIINVMADFITAATWAIMAHKSHNLEIHVLVIINI